LKAAPDTTRSQALALFALAGDRAVLDASVTTTGNLADAYREACDGMHAALKTNLPLLDYFVPEVTAEVFGANPSAGWTARLDEARAKFTGGAGIQYYYDFLKDLIDNWNELREELFADESCLCPDVGAFPKHLLLGDLTDPARSRTGFYPSPLVGEGR